ncbi:AAA family ATPase [Persicobacter psychrovividus]|uniref:AAA-ATPase-like domain-containing protein n=1 Tax=Persicobacter psychrovividus TaxID=387638 RepID=A0ABM7VM74_9BACT|nr:hypothetical protein PEPS_43900 [Persicobacter psychrovividus]
MNNLPIGKSDFRQIRQAGDYYIDKSLLIEDIMKNGAQTYLFPRPRRFGKTLNMSMLKYFYDVQEAEENAKLFDGLAIQKSDAWQHQGKYPVIFLSFKELKCASMEDFKAKFISFLGNLIRRQFKALLNSDALDEFDLDYLKGIVRRTTDWLEVERFLADLSYMLNIHYGAKPIILIDEYDAPIHASYSYGYFDEMIAFMRNFLSAGFKDNENLTKGAITGILRVAKENIFSGLNNIITYSILNANFSERFGLTQAEVDQLLDDAGSAENRDAVAEWYNGYSFGGTTQIYNPWSILNYVAHPKDGLKPHWVNTSSNDLIKEILPKADKETQDVLFDLLKGKKVTTSIEEFTVFKDLYAGKNATVLGLLLFSGYLTAEVFDHFQSYKLRIPNKEIELMFRRMLEGYLGNGVTQAGDTDLMKALLEQRANTFADALAQYVKTSFSYFDIGKEGNSEKIYHAFMLGLLAHLDKDYHIRSNREVGYGRADIYFYPKDTSNPKAWILEFKKKDKDDKGDLQSLAEDALKQIHDRDYLDEIKAHGHTDILCMGVAFEGKEVVCAF